MLPEHQLRESLSRLPLVAIHGPWYRLVDFGDLLTGPRGTPGPQWLWASRQAQRFTAPNGARTLYLAADPYAALLESETLFLDRDAQLVRRSFPPKVLFSVEATVANVLDLTDPAVQAALGTTVQELGGPWRTTPPGILAPTQTLGRSAFDCLRIAGLLAASSKRGESRSVVIFADRLADHPPSQIEVVGIDGARLP